MKIKDIVVGREYVVQRWGRASRGTVEKIEDRATIRNRECRPTPDGPPRPVVFVRPTYSAWEFDSSELWSLQPSAIIEPYTDDVAARMAAEDAERKERKRRDIARGVLRDFPALLDCLRASTHPEAAAYLDRLTVKDVE